MLEAICVTSLYKTGGVIKMKLRTCESLKMPSESHKSFCPFEKQGSAYIRDDIFEYLGTHSG